MIKRLLLLVILLAVPGWAWAQNARYDNIALGPRGAVANATIAVCTQPAVTTTQPCSPLASLFTAASGSVAAPNPLTADNLGNFHFYAAPGVYTIQIFGPQISPATVLTDITVGFGGAGSASSFNSTLYVGGPNAAVWGGGDIGSQLNAAYAAASATSCRITVLPQVGGGPYLFTTPIVMSTSGKYCIIEGSTGSVSSASGTLVNGIVLQYTHTTATAAWTIDWTPVAGGAYAGGSGIRDLALINSSADLGTTPCTTNGGCGSSATGLKIAGTNSGAQLADYRNFTTEGFGVGIDMSTGAGIGWAANFNNPSLAYNNIGFRTQGTEGILFNGGSISVNSTGVKFAVGGGVAANARFSGTHFDSNTVLAIDGTAGGSAGVVDCIGCHFENLGTTNVNYVNLAGGAGFLNLTGGEALEDNTSGGAAAYWFTANYLNCNGFEVTAVAGRAAPTSLFVVSTGGFCSVNNAAASVLNGNMGLANIGHFIGGNTLPGELGASHLQSQQSAAPTCTLGAGFGGGGAACSVAGSDSAGVISATAGAAPGNSSTVQLNFQKVFTGTAVACQVMAAGNFAAGASFQDTTPANNNDLFTASNNGVAFVNATVYKMNYWCPGR